MQYVLECSGAPAALDQSALMVKRGGRICLAAFPHEKVLVDLAHIVRNKIYVFGIRGEGKSATEDKVIAEIESYKPRVLKTSLSNEDEARLKTALSKAA